MVDHGGRRQRLVLIASPFQGHMTPMLQLGTYLQSKGFSITISHCQLNSPKPSNHPEFIFLPLPDGLSTTCDFAGANEFLKAINDNCRPHFLKQIVEIITAQKETCDEKESVVIIHDNLMSCAGSVANELGLPSIILRSSCAALFPVLKIIPQLHQDGRYPVKDSMLQEIVPELHPFRYKDLPFIGLPMHQTLETINMIISKTPPSAFIWNTLEFLEQSSLIQIRDHYQIPIFAIGPLHKIIQTPSTSFHHEDTSCISWLDKQEPKSVIYVSLGSIATTNEKVLTEMAWGLANSNQPFLWVVRPGSVPGIEWMEFLPEGLVAEMKGRGLIVKWAPQKEVLAHNAVGGFWSHCGWNSILESISEGVPMLCQPFELDQRINSRSLSYAWEMGVEIVVEIKKIECAIRKILTSNEGEEMRQRAKELQEKVKLAVNNSGSSQNSFNGLVEFISSL